MNREAFRRLRSGMVVLPFLLVGGFFTGCADDTGGADTQTPDAVVSKETRKSEEAVACVPHCGEKECGNDGCGGSCGTCLNMEGGADDSLCMPEGYCCEGGCLGLECGDNGCGGSCGTCQQGECKGGQCVMECAPKCAGKQCGNDGCGGTCGSCYDKSGGINDGLCRTDGTCCKQECKGKECGDDGCGGTCGDCPNGADCEAGVCQSGCVPECEGKECGFDGCTGTCGKCSGDDQCKNGQCVNCEPDCADMECGDDGCGGSCGACEADSHCDDGACECDDGFGPSPTGDCWPDCPEHAANNPESGTCECETDYHWNPAADECWVDCPENADNDPDAGECGCLPLYEWNPTGDECWPECQENSTYYPDAQQCVCDEGWLADLQQDQCVEACPPLGHPEDNACVCDEGYVLSATETECIEPPQVCALGGASYPVPAAFMTDRFLLDDYVPNEPTIIDLGTGLAWQGCDAGESGPACENGSVKKKKPDDAETYCQELEWGGHDDWRMPAMVDWLVAVDWGLSEAEDLFIYASGLTKSEAYWSSTEPLYAKCPQKCNLALKLDDYEEQGFYWWIMYAYASFPRRVRCLREPVQTGDNCAYWTVPFAEEPVVHHPDTGHFWQGCTAGRSGSQCEQGAALIFTLEEAQQHCEGLNWGGFDDWYLPDLNQFASMVDYGVLDDPVLSVELFPFTDKDSFWTSSEQGDRRWVFDFQAGQAVDVEETMPWAVRCIRECPGNFAGPDCLDCAWGWQGQDCQEEESCTDEPCFPGVQCSELLGPLPGVDCGDCPPGYAGDGTTCEDIDSCLEDPCFQGVECIDLAAPEIGFECGDCPLTHYGDGISCALVVACGDDPDACDPNAQCTDVGEGLDSCICKPGFEGDGAVCASTPGGFVTWYEESAGNWPWGIGAGDFDKDGLPDLAISTLMGKKIKLFAGDGLGTASLAWEYSVGDKPRAVAVGDFNSDGFDDCAVARETAGSVRTYHGAADGTMVPKGTFPVAEKPRSLKMYDLNNDGCDDLVAGHDFAYGVSVLLGDGEGGFAEYTTVDTGGFSHSALAAADFDQDGNLDLVVPVGFYESIKVLLGDGQGNFGEPLEIDVGEKPYGIAAADLDKDGNPDILVANNFSDDIHLIFGKGDGSFETPKKMVSGEAPRDFAVADFNGDGHLDFAVSNFGSDNVTLFYGQGNGLFAPPQLIPDGQDEGVPGASKMALGDFNGNSFPDIAVISQGASSYFILHN